MIGLIALCATAQIGNAAVKAEVGRSDAFNFLYYEYGDAREYITPLLKKDTTNSMGISCYNASSTFYVHAMGYYWNDTSNPDGYKNRQYESVDCSNGYQYYIAKGVTNNNIKNWVKEDTSVSASDTTIAEESKSESNTEDYYVGLRTMDIDDFRKSQVGNASEIIRIHAFGTPDDGNIVDLCIENVVWDENGDCHIEVSINLLSDEEVILPSFYQEFGLMYLNNDFKRLGDEYEVCIPYIENEAEIRFARIVMPEAGQAVNGILYEETDNKEDAIILTPGMNVLKLRYVTSGCNYNTDGCRWYLSNLSIPEISGSSKKYGNISYAYEID